MKISIDIHGPSLICGEEKAVELIAEAGFDAWDFSMFKMCGYDWGNNIFVPSDHPLGQDNYLDFARKLKRIGLDNGIACNQSHAPFPLECREIREYYCKRAIECTAEAGGKLCVVHPVRDYSPEENAQMYRELLLFAKDYGVKIATENIWKWDKEKDEACFSACSDLKSFKEHLDIINDDNFVACLDIGHAEMRGLNTSAVEMINGLGNKLQALHIHDNDKHRDSHQIPFSMSIDFGAIAKALKENNYNGYFTLETEKFLYDYNNENVFEGLKKLESAVRKFADMYENYQL